jgi:replicative DNA helicase
MTNPPPGRTAPNNPNKPQPGGTLGARLLPHNIEAEESVLGSMILAPNAINDVVSIIVAEDFYRPAHGTIFTACLNLFGRGEAIDPVTLADELRRTGQLDSIGGSGALVALQAGTPTTTNAAKYAELVAKDAKYRRLVTAAGEITEIGYEASSDIDASLEIAESTLYNATHRRGATPTTTLAENLAAALDRIEEIYEHEGRAGIASGYHDYDRLTGGFHRGEFTILGARPGMGKSIFGLDVATHIATHTEYSAMLFSLEMSANDLTVRQLAAAAKVNATKFRTGALSQADWANVTEAVGKLSLLGSKFLTNDSASITPMEIRAAVRREQQRQGGKLGVIVVDYIQLMTGREKAENRQVAVSEISREFKVLARDLNIAVVGISQLSRNLEQRADKRPMLSDLRESGSLEQDADVVAFLYRDDMYFPDSVDRGMVEIIIAKHRSGPPGTVRLGFQAEYVRFVNLGNPSQPAP